MIHSLFLFLRNPSKKQQTHSSKKRFLFLAWLLFIAVCIIQLIIYTLLDDYFHLPPNQVGIAIKNQSMIKTILMALLIMPVIEESAFRLGLIYSKINFIISVSCLVFLSFFIFFNQSILRSAIIASVSFIILHTTIQGKTTSLLSTFFENYKNQMVWCSILFFGLLHANNFFLKEIIPILPLLVLPQLFTGLICSYTRLNMGFRYSIIVHITFNLLPIFLLLLGKSFS